MSLTKLGEPPYSLPKTPITDVPAGSLIPPCSSQHRVIAFDQVGSPQDDPLGRAHVRQANTVQGAIHTVQDRRRHR
jgi:hypothetical protein